MADPWDITSAFARQLMAQASDQDRDATRMALMPINQAMAMERLKEQTALELATLPKKLSIEDAVRQLQEQRAEGRRIAEEGRQEETTKRAESRAEERLPRTIDVQSRKRIEEHRGQLEADIQAEKEHPEYFQKYRIQRGAVGVQNQHTPPLPPGYTHMIQEDMLSDAYSNLKKDPTIEFGLPISAWGKTFYPYRKRVGVGDGSPNPNVVQGKGNNPFTPTPASSVSSSAAEDMRQAAQKGNRQAPSQMPESVVPKAVNPSIFEDVPLPPAVGGDVNQPIPNAPIPPRRPIDLGGKDTQAFLYESIRRRGYSDEEANQILADLQKPKVRPTSDPDIFDVLVS